LAAKWAPQSPYFSDAAEYIAALLRLVQKMLRWEAAVEALFLALTSEARIAMIQALTSDKPEPPERAGSRRRHTEL
jgi:hypothetical protein